jgi:UDP:flavonoid glycosyltransferase YjiC (YdhE family)
MRLLLATTANAGHFGPMVPFAEACRAAGHEVLVAAPVSFAAAVERAGFRHWPCPDIDPDERAAFMTRFMAAPPEKRNEVTMIVGGEMAARSILPGMLSAIDEWRPDVVLREVGELGSALAAELRGVPQVQVLVGLSKFLGFTARLGARALAELRASLGLPPDEDGGFLHNLTAVSLLPESFEEPDGPSVHRFRPPVPAATSDWSGERPLVYTTFGTVAAGVPFAAETFRTVVEAVADLPVRVLATVGDGGAVDGFPANVRVERWVPQHDVLASAAAMVCHGGTGTVLGGLTAGVPIVAVPQFADQPDNAAHVAATGVGLAVGGGEERPATVEEVRAAVSEVLEKPSYRSAAMGVRDEVAEMPPVADAVPLIMGLA